MYPLPGILTLVPYTQVLIIPVPSFFCSQGPRLLAAPCSSPRRLQGCPRGARSSDTCLAYHQAAPFCRMPLHLGTSHRLIEMHAMHGTEHTPIAAGVTHIATTVYR